MIVVLNCSPTAPVWISVTDDCEGARGVKVGWRQQARAEADTCRRPQGDGRREHGNGEPEARAASADPRRKKWAGANGLGPGEWLSQHD